MDRKRGRWYQILQGCNNMIKVHYCHRPSSFITNLRGQYYSLKTTVFWSISVHLSLSSSANRTQVYSMKILSSCWRTTWRRRYQTMTYPVWKSTQAGTSTPTSISNYSERSLLDLEFIVQFSLMQRKVYWLIDNSISPLRNGGNGLNMLLWVWWMGGLILIRKSWTSIDFSGLTRNSRIIAWDTLLTAGVNTYSTKTYRVTTTRASVSLTIRWLIPVRDSVRKHSGCRRVYWC